MYIQYNLLLIYNSIYIYPIYRYHKALDSYKAGLQIEPDNSLCKQGVSKTLAAISEANGKGVDQERTAHGRCIYMTCMYMCVVYAVYDYCSLLYCNL